ncbi:hypothetical protein MF271_03165 [Deinococcus sp. KNUC1210]|uniref:hypothetical protein n=1 Tax=Deinococcus sp. KNUC1210 TaxID=2917691 RepID=UPI001EEFD13F|nr:hypothetical protein [Deinococcus sp. KNUC1210]ULH15657.1 hypothetical protein MF271_03165 [Deinococcus sp. KNUC1210]
MFIGAAFFVPFFLIGLIVVSILGALTTRRKTKGRDGSMSVSTIAFLLPYLFLFQLFYFNRNVDLDPMYDYIQMPLGGHLYATSTDNSHSYFLEQDNGQLGHPGLSDTPISAYGCFNNLTLVKLNGMPAFIDPSKDAVKYFQNDENLRTALKIKLDQKIWMDQPQYMQSTCSSRFDLRIAIERFISDNGFLITIVLGVIELLLLNLGIKRISFRPLQTPA